MGIITRRLTLVGAHEGKTIVLKAGTKEYEFTDGHMEVTGPSGDVDNLTKYLQRCYQAFPDPSRELDEARARNKEEADADEADADEAAQGDEHPGGTDDAEGGAGAEPAQQPEPDNGGGAAEPEAGEAGAGDADGDGQSPIVAALNRLDPADDEHWTADGKPKMAALEVLMGRADITRAQVDAAAPGFNREAARG